MYLMTASAIGSIVGMQSDQIQQIASEYADKVPGSSLKLGKTKEDEIAGETQTRIVISARGVGRHGKG